MKKLAISFLFLSGLAFTAFSQTVCVERAEIVKPALSEEAERVYRENLRDARAYYTKMPTDPDAIIWFGRRKAYLGEYKEAIELYSEGIALFPKDARFYRHRGHRYISIRCFDDAIRDFEKAAKLVKGKPDEIEPDGLPNARNTPTSTLQSNIWYHLGLAYYLKSDFKSALKAYRNCLKGSKNPDMLVATTNWLYATLRRLGKTDEAEKVLEPIADDLDIIENDSYYKLLKVYQGKIKADDLLKEIGADADHLNDASVGYGLGNWFLVGGEKEKALEIFRRITKGNQWSSFGYIAAEAELKRD
ncbi:MAG: tetratricopeptide repeat protein [Pyrinomonadaceae bacterium]